MTPPDEDLIEILPDDIQLGFDPDTGMPRAEPGKATGGYPARIGIGYFKDK